MEQMDLKQELELQANTSLQESENVRLTKSMTIPDMVKAMMLLFVKFYASTFFTLFVSIIHMFLIIMQIPCSQFFKLFSTSRN